MNASSDRKLYEIILFSIRSEKSCDFNFQIKIRIYLIAFNIWRHVTFYFTLLLYGIVLIKLKSNQMHVFYLPSYNICFEANRISKRIFAFTFQTIFSPERMVSVLLKLYRKLHLNQILNFDWINSVEILIVEPKG